MESPTPQQQFIVRKLCREACRENYDKRLTADAMLGAFAQYAEDEMGWSHIQIADYLSAASEVMRNAP